METLNSDEILLTIAIPTYNRIWKLRKTIQEILKYSGNDIEVLISDDSSNEETFEFYNSIEDCRLRYVRRENNAMYKQFFDNARGTYVLWLLDKDMIVYKELNDFLLFLRNYKNVITYGRCRLSFDPKMSTDAWVLFNKGYEGVKALGYRFWHPSGFFIHLDSAKKNLPPDLLSGAVYLWYGNMAFTGKGAYYQRKLVKTENIGEAARVKSIMSGGRKAEELFFSPIQLACRMKQNVESMSILPLSGKEKRNLCVDMIEREMRSATFGYSSIMSNRELCRHYGVPAKKIKKDELISITLSFGRKAFHLINSAMRLEAIDKVYLNIRVLKIIVAILSEVIVRG